MAGGTYQNTYANATRGTATQPPASQPTPSSPVPPQTSTPLSSQEPSSSSQTSPQDKRIAYRATVFEDSQYEVIKVDGEIRNSAGPAHLPMLHDLLSKGVITPDKFVEMYAGLMRADKETVSEFTAIVDKGGKGKEFYAKDIINETTSRSAKK
ncbi:hypothetical protein BDQ17DRAFT_543203 [Cyathus striatus]|nr:hypothetical protein BDQ17DRAFT_543203 [Cyathus striatus]